MSAADLITDVHHTAVCVTDFEGMRAFLVDFLGFELEGEMDDRSEPPLGTVVGLPGATIRWAMFRHGGHRVELFKYHRPECRMDAPRQCDVGFTHLAFRVADVEAVHARAVEAGHEPISPPQLLRGGATKVFYLRGPDGVVVEFVEFPRERRGR